MTHGPLVNPEPIEPRRHFEITVPGSIANLGPGFDTLAVAVQLYLRLNVTVVDGCEKLKFHFAGQQLTGENYIERAFRFLARQTGASFPSLEVEVQTDIPMRAGLGSSAAATVASCEPTACPVATAAPKAGAIRSLGKNPISPYASFQFCIPV